MEAINAVLMGIPAESRTLLYNGFGFVMHIVMVVFLIIRARRMLLNGASILKLFTTFYVAFFVGNFACNKLGVLTNGLIPKINLGVAFLFFLLTFVLLIRFCKAPIRPFLDNAIPVFILGRGIGIIGCLFTGCCHGFEAEWGIYSNITKTTVVPTVLFDMLLSYAIAGYICLPGKKCPAPGNCAAKGILLFGVLRYTIDVLRDNNKLFGMVTAEGICGIIYVLAGLIMLYVIDKKHTAYLRND